MVFSCTRRFELVCQFKMRTHPSCVYLHSVFNSNNVNSLSYKNVHAFLIWTEGERASERWQEVNFVRRETNLHDEKRGRMNMRGMCARITLNSGRTSAYNSIVLLFIVASFLLFFFAATSMSALLLLLLFSMLRCRFLMDRKQSLEPDPPSSVTSHIPLSNFRLIAF